MKLIKCHLPTIVKHVLAPKNDFGIQKKHLVNLQKFWDLRRPPPPLGKIPFFGGGSVPKVPLLQRSW